LEAFKWVIALACLVLDNGRAVCGLKTGITEISFFEVAWSLVCPGPWPMQLTGVYGFETLASIAAEYSLYLLETCV